jgi:4-hydroxybenzoate polyprenyltransferase
MQQTAKGILELIKKRFAIPVVAYVWTTVIGSMVALKGIPRPLQFVYAILTPFLILTAVYVLNDAMDYELDRINKIDRAIATGKITPKEGKIAAFILFSLGLVLSALINVETLLLSLILSILGYFYSTPPVRLRNRLFAKHVITASGFFLSGLIGGAIVGNVSIQVIFLGLIMFMTVFSGTPIFDIPDLEGDKAGRAKSLGVLYGPRTSLKISIIGFSLVTLITIFSYRYVGFNVLTPLIVSSFSLAFIWFAYNLLKKWRDTEYSRKILKTIIGMNFLFQLSFFVGILI